MISSQAYIWFYIWFWFFWLAIGLLMIDGERDKQGRRTGMMDGARIDLCLRDTDGYDDGLWLRDMSYVVMIPDSVVFVSLLLHMSSCLKLAFRPK